jgi:hypothetical protein
LWPNLYALCRAEASVKATVLFFVC